MVLTRRPFMAIGLALILALTTASMAIGRAGMIVGPSSVFCINGQVVSVAVDGNGHPTDARHICPDCVIGALAMIDAQIVPERDVAAGVGLRPLAPQALASRPWASPKARAPPFCV